MPARLYPTPTSRSLKIFAFDPMRGRLPMHRISVDVPYEPLNPGPVGSRVAVVDYDSARDCYYEPVDLEHPSVLMNGGLEPTESEPRFHQQMVYAVAMKVVENFERALGRRFYFYRRQRLLLIPHAFQGANAYYSSRRNAVLFGYFPATPSASSLDLPGQNVFSCLSHDIIAHEVTHAVVDRLRQYFKWPTNPDMLAFHEAFSDIIAIFQHFSFPGILNQAIQETSGDLRRPTPLLELAAQFGYATGKGSALRSAVDSASPRHATLPDEPHERGAVLVAAIFDAFLTTFQAGIQDLLRIATGGTGRLPEGYLHPDLVNRLAGEARTIAASVLRMCMRAFDYLPPVDITFGDFLRALVTADFELNPDDRSGLRRNMVEAFRIRGIYPEGVFSLSEESLLWERAPGEYLLAGDVIEELTRQLTEAAAKSSRSSLRDWPIDQDTKAGLQDEVALKKLTQTVKFSAAQSDLLRLGDPYKFQTKLIAIHPAFRIGQDGQLLVEAILQYVQHDRRKKSDYGGVAFRGGSTVIVQSDGRLRYVISKPIHSQDSRRQQMQSFLRAFDARDALQIWRDEMYQKTRLANALGLSTLDRRGH
ncbi:MAG: hypothetical protein HY820_17000 [Acidobacteria bacterium]|nr:hypothetical protein [Acidobacteriota bacterium]